LTVTADPVSWLVIEKGWKVVGSDGKDVGRIEEIAGDTGKDIFNGLVVTTGFFSTKYVPSERVRSIVDGRVELDLTHDEVKHLDDHEPPPPSAQFRAD
jgi:hypothetical protein